MSSDHIHFVTGRLAEHALKAVLVDLSQAVGFRYSVDVLPITVAALMTPEWIARHIAIPEQATKVVIPGYCSGDLTPLTGRVTTQVVCGPRDLRRLPEMFGHEDPHKKDYGQYDIEIIAEINHAPRLTLAEILAEARRLSDAGADVIDVGCEPGFAWAGVSDCVRALCDAGHRVSIDSLQPAEIGPAVRAGAELVLSVNSSNRDAAADWGCEVVAIPDDPKTLGGLDQTIEKLSISRVPLRIDPILEPIGCGFADSLRRYSETRHQYVDAEMMMGIGNLTELTDADSAGVNVLLLGICQELGIRSVLTTQVINWARTSVQECDLARRLVHFAIKHGIPPKHLEPKLVALRDDRVLSQESGTLARLHEQIKDNNFRIFSEEDGLHLISAAVHLTNNDPFLLFEQLLQTSPKNIDVTHAFYLGYEMAKAAIAQTLGKQYQQDEALDWGFLTVEEKNHRLKRFQNNSDSPRK